MPFLEDLSEYDELLDSLTVTVGSTRKVRHVLTFSDRKIIQQMLQEGYKVKDIALTLDVTPATIYCDIRKGGHPYIAEKAQGITH